MYLKRVSLTPASREMVIRSPRLAAMGVATLSGFIPNFLAPMITRIITRPGKEKESHPVIKPEVAWEKCRLQSSGFPPNGNNHQVDVSPARAKPGLAVAPMEEKKASAKEIWVAGLQVSFQLCLGRKAVLMWLLRTILGNQN